MANLAGGEAGAGGVDGGEAGAGGVDGGEGDVPDIRVALGQLRKLNVGNRSQNWRDNNLNSPNNREISFDEKEDLFINYLDSLNFAQEELERRYQTPDTLNRQGPVINGMNANGCLIMGAMGRKRRLCLFLMVMLFGFAQAVKIAKGSQDLVPQRFRDPAQLKGDIKACQEGLKVLAAQLQAVHDQIEALDGEAVRVPGVFSKPLEIPKRLGKK